MIEFHKVRWKNLLSTGNQFTEIQLNRSPTTLIVGENGNGKCLDPNTEIDIEISDSVLNKKFKKFMEKR